MHTHRRPLPKRQALFLLTFLVACTSYSGAEAAVRQEGIKYEPELAKQADGQGRKQVKRTYSSSKPFSLSLEEPAKEKEEEIAKPSPPGVPRKIGFVRELKQFTTPAATASRLLWQSTPEGGWISSVSITSPRAKGLRVGILIDKVPASARFRFSTKYAEYAEEVTGAEIQGIIKRNAEAGGTGDASRTFWTPTVTGSEVTIEIVLPAGVDPAELVISIPKLSHQARSPISMEQTRYSGYSNGFADYCHLDSTCYAGTWGTEEDATARMSFVEPDGSSYTCTGTLLNDKAGSLKPYFLSAWHCISTQPVASTLETYWFYRSNTCGSDYASDYQVKADGAQLLHATSDTDTSFMKLASNPPVGAKYAGWDAGAQQVGTPVTAVHHPQGDFQKISFGSVTGYRDCTPTVDGYFSCTTSTLADGTFLHIEFSQGVTEGGSSGSGLFASDSGNHYLVGQLTGGQSSCSNPAGRDSYGRFDLAYGATLNKWLDPATLTVAKSGTGSGSVSSSPAGISCGSTCNTSYPKGTAVTLTATPVTGSTFTGWSGACSGTGTCTLTLSGPAGVTAGFASSGDVTRPIISAFAIPATSVSAIVPISTLTASDNVAVTGYFLSTSSTTPSATDIGWTTVKPVNYTFTGLTVGVPTVRTLYAFVKDAANNISLYRSASVTITRSSDATRPAISAFTIPATSVSAIVPISTLTASDNVAVTGYFLSTSSTPPIPYAVGWSAARPVSYTFTGLTVGVPAVRTLYAFVKDAANNISLYRSASVTITRSSDATRPAISSFTLPATARSVIVPVSSLLAGDNVAVTGYFLSTSSTTPNAYATGWSAARPVSYAFAGLAGGVPTVKTLYAFVKDAANNISLSRSASVTITKSSDVTGPTISAFTIPATSVSAIVPISTLTASDKVAVTGYYLSTSSATPNPYAAAWRSSKPVSYTFGGITPSVPTVRTLYLWVKDAANNLSLRSSDSVTLTVP